MARSSRAPQSSWQNSNVMLTQGSLKLDSLEQAKVTSIFLQNSELASINQVELVLAEMGCALARGDVEAFCKDVGFEDRTSMSLSQFLALMQRVKYKEQELPVETSDISHIFAALGNSEGKASVQKIKDMLSQYGLAKEAFNMPKGTPKDLNLEQFASMTGLDGRGMEGRWLPSLDPSAESGDDEDPKEEAPKAHTGNLVLSVKALALIKNSAALKQGQVAAQTDPHHKSSSLPSQEPNDEGRLSQRGPLQSQSPRPGQTQATKASAEPSACLKAQKKGPRRLRLTRVNPNKRMNQIFYDLESFLHTVRCPLTESLAVDPSLLTEPIGPALQEAYQKEQIAGGQRLGSGAQGEPASPMSPVSPVSLDALPPGEVSSIDGLASSKSRLAQARARPFSAIPSIKWRGGGSAASRRPRTATAARPQTAPPLGRKPDRGAAALHRTALGAPGHDRAPPQSSAKRRSPSPGPARPPSPWGPTGPDSSRTMSGLFDSAGNYTFGGLSLAGYTTTTPTPEDRNRAQRLAPIAEAVVTASPCAARVTTDWAVDGGADPDLPVYDWSCALPASLQALGP